MFNHMLLSFTYTYFGHSKTVVRVCYYKNTLNVQIIVQKCVIKPLDGKQFCVEIA
jgi:hypothetical protein